MYINVYDTSCMNWFNYGQFDINFPIVGLDASFNWLVTFDAYQSC